MGKTSVRLALAVLPAFFAFKANATWQQVTSLTTWNYCQYCDTTTDANGVTAGLQWKNDMTAWQGWFIESVGGAFSTASYNPANGATYTKADGSATAGGVYSFGNTSNANRALGGITDATLGNISYGLLLYNTSGSTMNYLNISYRGEIWRTANTTTVEGLKFSYAKGSPGAGESQFFSGSGTGSEPYLSPGTLTGVGADSASLTWVAASAGNYTPAATFSGTSAALIGTNAPNYTDISFTLSGLAVADGDFIMLRWTDSETAASQDAALAIDAICITATAPVPEPSTYAAGIGLAALVGGTLWRRSRNARKSA